jgi:error-prone DNA polymerase
MTCAYAELQVTTNFSFLRGGSHAHELVARAKALGLSALAVTDRNTLAGAVRAHIAAKQEGLQLVIGARLDLQDAPSLLAFPRDRAAYGRLCRLLTIGQRRAQKGECELYLADVADHAGGQIFVGLPPENWSWRQADPANRDFEAALRETNERLDAPLYLAASQLYRGDDRSRIAALSAIAARCRTPLIASNDVLYHEPQRRPLQDVLTCIREKCTIHQAGLRLEANAERHLKGADEMARLFRGFEEAVARTFEIAKACNFSLDELAYEYPDEPTPPGKTPQQHLEDLAQAGARWRYPQGVPDKVADTIKHELALISELDYAPYFLTVHDIVNFARAQDILCQGRGSAANSAVCYCLGITSVDPIQIDLLFERFVSPERKEPPDIDVDFEHERREEVIQYIYRRYGRERAGLAATVICYRSRSALREVGKAMGLKEDTLSALAGILWGMRSSGDPDSYVREAGLDPADPLLRRTLELADELMGFPRHLSQHVGGFVLTRGPLSEVVPIGNAAMEDRTVIEWDKDDLDALGLLKVDVLGLGMLSCIHKCFDLLGAHYGRKLDLAGVPQEDPAVYDMLCKADSIGVFQVESRAQMNMLPRLKPRCFYDLVIEVAIVRPGPIQGDMVHPYLRRRDRIEPVDYPRPGPEHGPSDELEGVLKKTLGVPLFQEQAMRIAIVAAKFSPEEANQLRYAMATFRRRGTIDKLKDKFIARMVARGYDPQMSERCFKQIEGFGEYGFPESHSASFSLLVYVSSWLKCHYPAAFACGLLNSQPMGFYAPAQIVRDAREHGVELRPADLNWSLWDSTLEPGAGQGWALRLGLRLVEGLRENDAARLIDMRHDRPFEDVDDLWRRAGVSRAVLERLAAADTFRSMGLDRRQALWEVRALSDAKPLPLFEYAKARETGPDPAVQLPAMALSEHVVNDYQMLRLSLKAHPMEFLRAQLRREKVLSCEQVRALKDGDRVCVAGVVLVRQRPGSAKGVIFMTIEDETGVANAVVWPKVLERYRKTVIGARLVLIRGRIQRAEEIIHVVAGRLEDRSAWLLALAEGGRDFASPLARADEVRRPASGSWHPSRHPRAQRIIPKSRDFH